MITGGDRLCVCSAETRLEWLAREDGSIDLFVRCSSCGARSEGIAVGPLPEAEPARMKPFWWMRYRKKRYAPLPKVKRPGVIYDLNAARGRKKAKG